MGEVLAQSWPGCQYEMEFFNPLRNERYENILERQFGCELASCFRNIAEPGDAAIDADIERTWGREPLTFTKEVFSPLKLEAFTRHFDCFVMLRAAEHSFPPKRLRIWSFYEHAWYALAARGWWHFEATTARTRAYEAHEAMRSAIVSDAERLRVPVILYEDLFGHPGEVRETLARGLPEVPAGLVEQIVATRNGGGRLLAAA